MYYVSKRTASEGIHEVYQAKNPRMSGDKCLGLWNTATEAVYQARKIYNLVMAG